MSQYFEERSKRGIYKDAPDWLWELGLSTRAFNVIWYSHRQIAYPRTLAELSAMTDRQMLRMRSCGIETVKEIRGALRQRLEGHEVQECWAALYPTEFQ